MLAVCAFALIITLPALWATSRAGIPVAFFAVVSIAVIGLYIAYVIPVYLRLRAGDAFEPGSVDPRREVPLDVHDRGVWVALCVIIFCLPVHTGRRAVERRVRLERASTTRRSRSGGLFLIVGLWWLLGAKNHYRGPVRTIQFDEAAGVIEDEPEAPAPA